MPAKSARAGDQAALDDRRMRGGQRVTQGLRRESLARQFGAGGQPRDRHERPCPSEGRRHSKFASNDGRKVAGRYNETDVQFLIVSVGDAAQQGKRFVFGRCCRAMLVDDGGCELRKRVQDQRAVTLEKHRGVCWLPRSKSVADGAAFPLCPVRPAAEVAKVQPLEPAAGLSIRPSACFSHR